MIDMHHDLLSIIYYCYLRDDYSFLDKWISNFREDNVSGLLANLYFMNEEEMVKHIGNNKIDVIEMFKKSIELFKKYLPNEKVIFSIEGCDYIKDTTELEKLYDLGLRNILLVWNNPNKYGSGNKGDYGLTDEGRELLIKAIDLGICIDLSHMNKNTFYDTIKLIREQQDLGKKIKVIASHSNCFELCNHERNLDDDQIKALGSVDGILGIVGYSLFVKDDKHDNEDLKELYLKHVDRAISILGINNVGIATDDMKFLVELCDEDIKELVFDYKDVNKEIRYLLKNKYNEDDIDKIMYKNIYNKLFKEEIK